MVKVGDIWRKAGPCDWIKVVRIQMPGHAGYDGGLPGCSVRCTNFKGNFERRTWFYTVKNDADFEKQMTESYRERA